MDLSIQGEKNSNKSYKIFLKHLLLITEKRMSWSPAFYLGICVSIPSGYAWHGNSFPHTFSSWGMLCHWRVYCLLSPGSAAV